MLHLKKWGGMLGLVALIAVASAASYQFLNSGGKHSSEAGEIRKLNPNSGQVTKIASGGFSKSYTYSDDFNDGNVAVNEKYGGNLLRKAIDFFCHAAIAPDFLGRIEKLDQAFAASEFLPQMRWIKDVNDDIYDPTYTDMLRVAFTSEFGRGKLQDLVALLSGRNFETKEFEESIGSVQLNQLFRAFFEN